MIDGSMTNVQIADDDDLTVEFEAVGVDANFKGSQETRIEHIQILDRLRKKESSEAVT
jgi:hypothetical protein